MRVSAETSRPVLFSRSPPYSFEAGSLIESGAGVTGSKPLISTRNSARTAVRNPNTSRSCFKQREGEDRHLRLPSDLLTSTHMPGIRIPLLIHMNMYIYVHLHHIQLTSLKCRGKHIRET